MASLITLSVLEATRLPPRADATFAISVKFGRDALVTGSFPHDESVTVNEDLAFEISKADLNHHKMLRTPIKLTCIATDKETGAQTPVGYVIVDLRSARSGPESARIYPVLNSDYKTKPELKVALAILPASQLPHRTAEPLPALDPETQIGDIPVLLLPTGHYLVGAGDDKYIFTVTLGPIERLVDLIVPGTKLGESFCFQMTLFGETVSTEPFVDLSTSPPTERASVRIQSTPRLLGEFYKRASPMKIFLVSGEHQIAVATVPLVDLAGIAGTPSKTVDGSFPMLGSAPNSNSMLRVSVGIRLDESQPGPRHRQQTHLPAASTTGSYFPAQLQQAAEALGGESEVHHFQCSVDLKAIKITQMPVQTARIYLRYSYPFFGSSAPIITAPLEVQKNQERTLAQGYCSFDFAASPTDVRSQFYSSPIRAELYQVDKVQYC